MTESALTFADLGLNEAMLKALRHVGYETPSPIQAQSIPPILEGRDLLGLAQTGTGKTAAFALPIIQSLNTRVQSPQVLVLTPTRELAIQVAEAFQKYAHYLRGFHVLPIYGGSSYSTQISALRRGVQVVVGTPGRVMDHMRKGTLKLDNLKHMVLDEADEMLRMGFIDDVEWVFSELPEGVQTALFSATMPAQINKVARTYLKDPVKVEIAPKVRTAESVRQRYWPVSGIHKFDALTRILEAETVDGMIIFVRTKTSTVDLTEKLESRGFRAQALNGDISQAVRERTVDRFKKGAFDILVATDVAARGLDVDRITHVLNYDIPYDSEAYVHRIGRTGRAGRTGDAIMFVAKREIRMLRTIERELKTTIESMRLPSHKDINEQRLARFKQRIVDTLATADDLDIYQELLQNVVEENEIEPMALAAVLAKMVQGDEPLLLSGREPVHTEFSDNDRGDRRDRGERGDRREKPQRERKGKSKALDIERTTYRIEVGYNDGVKPGNIVGAIANEAELDSQYIGEINITDDYSTVDLPTGMPNETFQLLKRVRICNKPMNITPFSGPVPASRPPRKPKTGGQGGNRKPRRDNS